MQGLGKNPDSTASTAWTARHAAATVLFCCLLGAVLIPRVRVGGVSVGADDFMAVLAGFCLPFFLLEARMNRFFKMISALWIFIIGTGVLFGLLASNHILGYYDFPSEMWQYVKRGVFFSCAFVFTQARLLSPKLGTLLVTLVLLFASAIGLFQVFGGTLGVSLSDLYARSDRQYIGLVERTYYTQRTFGIAGNSIAWGGFSVFSGVYALSFLLLGESRNLGLRTVLHGLLFVTSIFHVLLSGSRTAIATCIAGVLLCAGLALIKARIKMGRWIRMGILGVVAVLVLAPVLADRFEFLSMRVQAGVLELQAGTGRIDQVYATIAYLVGPLDWFIGVSNAVQRHVVTWGSEVEPVYLLVNYGVLGLGARYLLLAMILRRSWLCISKPYPALGLASVCAVISYFVFSFGFYFFQEIAVGCPVWLVFGMATGCVTVSAPRESFTSEERSMGPHQFEGWGQHKNLSVS